MQVFQLYRENLEDLLAGSNTGSGKETYLNIVLAEHNPTGLVQVRSDA